MSHAVPLAVGTGSLVAGGGLLLVAAAAAVYRDATRIGVDAGSPRLWAGLVALTAGAGVATAAAVPDAPLPGVFVLVALGPLLYLLERDDSVHGEDPADPTRLPSAGREPSAAEAAGDAEGAGKTDAPEQTPADPER